MSIIRIQKNTLDIDTNWGDNGSVKFTDNPETFTIDHFSGASTSDSSILSFSVTPTDSQVPFLNKTEFVQVIRNKVDVSANGPSQKSAKDAGVLKKSQDLPISPKQMPLGFIELKDKEE